MPIHNHSLQCNALACSLSKNQVGKCYSYDLMAMNTINIDKLINYHFSFITYLPSPATRTDGHCSRFHKIMS